MRYNILTETYKEVFSTNSHVGGEIILRGEWKDKLSEAVVSAAATAWLQADSFEITTSHEEMVLNIQDAMRDLTERIDARRIRRQTGNIQVQDYGECFETKSRIAIGTKCVGECRMSKEVWLVIAEY